MVKYSAINFLAFFLAYTFMMASVPLIGGSQGRKHKGGKGEKDVKCII